ncbi:MAG TPA: hypothetical protein VN397_04330 [Candidatus Methylomirabilis sp.]|nr:hypothetical protein [Candidatus Methylomirabilis sp.]
MATPNGRGKNICAKCGAPLRIDNRECIMGPLCDTVARSNYQSPFSTRPKIGVHRDVLAPPNAPPNEHVTNPGYPVVSFDDTTLSELPERVDFCKGCGLHIERSCTKCPHCGSSHHPPPTVATASAKPAPSSTEVYTAIKQGLGTPRAPQIDDAPVVTWEGPNGSSDGASAIDEYELPVPGIPDSQAPDSG